MCFVRYSSLLGFKEATGKLDQISRGRQKNMHCEGGLLLGADMGDFLDFLHQAKQVPLNLGSPYIGWF